MIAGLKPYPKMRDSGVAWLGGVPDHWDVLPNRAIFGEREVNNLPDEPMLSVTIKRGVIPQADQLSDTGKKDGSNLDRTKYKLVEPGDLAYNKMRAWQGAIGASAHRGIVSPAYIVQRPRTGQNPLYFHHLLRTPGFATEAERWSYGITSDQWSLRPQHFKMIYCPSPPTDEQAAIVRFLDHADRRIRRSIVAKQTMIRLLEEQKAAVIHQAVTRGVNPDASTKPSGIDRLGDIPAHWKITRVKDEFENLNTRRVPLSATARGEMTLRAFDYYGASGVIDRVDEFLFDEDLLLIAEDGANLVLRNLPLAIVARGKFWVNNHAHILRPRRGDLNYLASYMEGLDYRPWITGAAQPKLTQDRLMAIKIAVAPAGEQRDIMSSVAQRTSRLRTALSLARQEVKLLQEYRVRLISDVVTGKLDVRAAAALPVEALDDPLGVEDTVEGEDPTEADFDAEEALEEV